MKNVRFFCIIIVLAMVTSCTSIDVATHKEMKLHTKMKKVAVFPFDVKGATWGDEFADAISHQFFKQTTIEVVEREAIERILKEQQLSMTGLINDKQAVKIGKMLGADVIILGRGHALRHYEKGRQIPNLIDTFTLKAIAVETGSLLCTVRKEPGKAWTWEYRAKYCCSLTLIWDSVDILVQSSRYDEIARQVVKRINLIMEKEQIPQG
ncbi:MAG: CsgG/HfaB family protein [Spirochaetota bacterium]